MSIGEYSVEELAEMKKRANQCAKIHSVVYGALFPITMPLLGFALMGLLDASVINIDTIFVVLMLCSIPLSIPVCIGLMWSSYNQGRYEKTILYSSIPLYTFSATVLISLIVAAFTVLEW